MSRTFTAAQVTFLRKLTWHLEEEDFAELTGCEARLAQIHGVSVCVIDATTATSLRQCNESSTGTTTTLVLGTTLAAYLLAVSLELRSSCSPLERLYGDGTKARLPAFQ